jgi:hypothetical protein
MKHMFKIASKENNVSKCGIDIFDLLKIQKKVNFKRIFSSLVYILEYWNPLLGYLFLLWFEEFT